MAKKRKRTGAKNSHKKPTTGTNWLNSYWGEKSSSRKNWRNSKFYFPVHFLVVLITITAFLAWFFTSWMPMVQDLSFVPERESTMAAATRVQTITGNNGGGGTTVSATWPSATTNGNLVVAIISFFGGNGITVTPPASWTLAVRSDRSNKVGEAIYYIENAASQSGASTWTLTNTQATLTLIEYSGMVTGSALDKTAFASSKNSPALSGTTATTSQNDEVVVVGLTVRNGSATFSSPTNGFSIINSVSSSANTTAFLEKIVSTTGTQSTQATVSATEWAGAIATFKIAALPPNNPPTGSFNSAVQKTDGSGSVDISIEADDADTDNTKAKIEFETDSDGACDGPWAAATLIGPATADFNDTGGAPDINNISAYQVGSGTNTRIITSSGSNTVDFDWDSSTDLPTANGTQCLRLTVNDDTADQTTPATQTVSVDNVAPSGLTSLIAGTTTSSSQQLSWSAVAETNFNHYEIWFGANQSDVQNRTGTAMEWDQNNDAALSTRTTTSTNITALGDSTTYYFKIFAVDNNGNEETVVDINTTTPAESMPGRPGFICPDIYNTRVTINNNDAATDSRTVTLNLVHTNAKMVIASEDSTFNDQIYYTVSPTLAFTLSKGSGIKTVFVQFKNNCKTSAVVSDNIFYSEPTEPEEETPPAEPELSEPQAPEVVPPPTYSPLNPGDLIRGSRDAVYYYGFDHMRHTFPNSATYFSWYTDFSGIKTIPDEQLATIPLGQNVTSRPGVRLLKIQTDPKVYAVGLGGVLRWITAAEIAESLYGPLWESLMDDLSDAFFTNYIMGTPVYHAPDYDPIYEQARAVDIDTNLGLKDPPDVIITPTIPSEPDEPEIITPPETTPKGPKPACIIDSTITAYMELESVSEQVRTVQELLQCLGYFPADISPTAYYGPITVDAVMDFQEANGIDPIGTVGPQTRQALNQYVY